MIGKNDVVYFSLGEEKVSLHTSQIKLPDENRICSCLFWQAKRMYALIAHVKLPSQGSVRRQNSQFVFISSSFEVWNRPKYKWGFRLALSMTGCNFPCHCKLTSSLFTLYCLHRGKKEEIDESSSEFLHWGLIVFCMVRHRYRGRGSYQNFWNSVRLHERSRSLTIVHFWDQLLFFIIIQRSTLNLLVLLYSSHNEYVSSRLNH